MKKYLLLIALSTALLSCNHTVINDDNDWQYEYGFAKGADISWLTEQEHDGVQFFNEQAEATECMQLLRETGMNAVRLRVWVNHSTGWCNKQDVIEKAQRAKQMRLRLMIDFHYSDYFADPSKQTIPSEWQNYSLQEMSDAVAMHTTDVLQALKDLSIEPEWVQVGNETRNGMLWPIGQLWDNNGDLPNGWKNYAQLTTAGYNAVKQVFPEAKVIVHIDNAYENNNWFFRKLKAAGGKFDVIGLSHYPQTANGGWANANKQAINNIKLLVGEFYCQVIICEIGTKQSNLDLAQEIMTDFMTQLAGQDSCTGVFYWEPQVYNNWKPEEYKALKWGAYDMGAFTNEGKPSAVLKTLWK